MKVLALSDVVQVDILEDYQLLIVLSGKLFFGYEVSLFFKFYLFIYFRTTSYHVPSGCSGPTRPYGGIETSETDIITYLDRKSVV